MSEGKVLVVDDDAEFASVLAERMGGRGFEVDKVQSGEKALEQASERSYDAIVLDLVMPGMDGIETLRRLLENDPDLQVILLTGHGVVSKGVEAVKLGALDFLEKPAELNSLLAKIKEAQSNKMLLVSKRMEDRIGNILKDKGW